MNEGRVSLGGIVLDYLDTKRQNKIEVSIVNNFVIRNARRSAGLFDFHWKNSGTGDNSTAKRQRRDCRKKNRKSVHDETIESQAFSSAERLQKVGYCFLLSHTMLIVDSDQ